MVQGVEEAGPQHRPHAHPHSEGRGAQTGVQLGRARSHLHHHAGVAAPVAHLAGRRVGSYYIIIILSILLGHSVHFNTAVTSQEIFAKLRI